MGGGHTALGRQNYGSTESGMDGLNAENSRRKDTKRRTSEPQNFEPQSSQSILPTLEVIDPGIWTFRICVVGLSLTYCTGFGVIVYGAIVQSITDKSDDGYEPSYLHNRYVTPFVQLALSFWVTALSDIAGLVHSTSLRFTLLASRKLTFNSNWRLFMSCPNSRIHWWPVNIIWAWSLISSYACGSMILVQSVYDPSHTGSDLVSGYALIFLGLGLLGQASIATWALIVTKIPTWSTNPIHTAMICQSQGWLAPLSQRTMMSVHEAQKLDAPDAPTLPKSRQGSLLGAHIRVRRALIFTYVVTLLAFLWFAGISIAYQLGNGIGPSWGSFSRSYSNDWSLIPNWKDHTAFLGIPTTLGQSFYTFGPWLVCKYLLSCVFLGGITINLHVVELLVQSSRDESLWRQTASAGGMGPRKYGAFNVAFLTWQTAALFVFKTALHWVFSLAFGIYYEGIEMRIPQVCFTAVSLFLLSSLATFLALWRPKGPQPATFGHLPTLVDLIDVWPCRVSEEGDREQCPGKDVTGEAQGVGIVTLYWGDKGEDEDGVRRSGTAYTPLKPIVMSALYL